jgi:heat shock protein HtpX
MSSAPSSAPAPDRAIAGLAALAILVVFGSYLITILLAAACVYLPVLWYQYSPGLYAIMAFVAGLAISGVIVVSLVPRRDTFSPPGVRLRSGSHPRLFAEINQIARGLGEELPSDVYATLEVNAWVGERGGWMGIGDRRVMGLGLPLLQALTTSQFRALLAHEFAHYYTGDTRIGPWVYRARASMALTLLRLDSRPAYIHWLTRNFAGQAVYLVAMIVLIGYWKLFLRVSQFVSRRHELRADQLACWMAGSAALADGLRTTEGASAVFPLYWQSEVLPALKAGFRPPISRGFKEFITSPAISQITSQVVQTALNKLKTNSEDTHPCLRDRILAAQSMPSRSQLADQVPAISLVEDLGAVELEMLRALNFVDGVANLKEVTWENVATIIYIPKWRATARQYASQIAGITPASLPDKIENLQELAKEIANPRGILLNSEERRELALGLLGTSFALVLIDAGWELHARPGECFLSRDSRQIAPLQIVHEIRSGKLSRADWMEECRVTEIAALDFGTAPGGL